MAHALTEPEPLGPLHELWEESARAMHAREEALILSALEAEDWYLRGAARRLGVQCSTLQSTLARHPEIDRTRKRRPEGRPKAA